MLRSSFIVLELFVILNYFTFVTCKGTYTINAPGIIHSNRKYTVCATLHNISEPATLLIGISSKHSWYNTQKVSLQRYQTKMLDFYPPKLDSTEQYELFAQGVRGLNFYTSAKIQVGERDGTNIYIETDKGAYKPGDLLRFRVVILNEHAKTMSIIEPIKVQIFDGAANRVKQFKDIPLSKGIYVNEFQISEDPVLGSWIIRVFIGGKYALQNQVEFQVEKYVLPKFSTYIETDTNFVKEDRYIKINVFGLYTYNKYVEGTVNLTFTNLYRDTNFLANYSSDITDFTAKFEIDLKDFEHLLTTKNLFVEAYLTEKHTNIVQNILTVIYLQEQRYKITIPEDEIEFRNEKTFLVKAKVQYWNDSVVQDYNTSIFMKHGSKIYESKLDENGVATFEYMPDDQIYYIFSYKNSTQKLHSLEPYRYFSKTNVQTTECNLKINNKSLKLNSEVEITVESDQNIAYLVYTLTSHGNIIKHEIVHLESDKNSHKIRLMTSNEMVPVSFLYVHYINGDNFIFCETKIKLPEELENKLSISAPSNVKPGEDIMVTINAQPDSHVAIVAIDLDSMLYHDVYRINRNLIIENMRSDLSYVDGSLSKDPGILSGLITLTDGYYDKHYDTDYKSEFNIIKDKRIVREMDVRSYFPETWIFTDYEVTSAVSTINFKVPHSITTWVLTAFSINEKTGIGLLDNAVNIIASKEFFISTYLPYSIKHGEIASIPIVIFNYYSESLESEVLFENSLNEFKFVNEMNNKTTNSLTETRNIIVPANSGKSVNFLIFPLKLGEIEIRIKAQNKLATDEVLQKLLVEPSGLATFHNHELFVQLKPGKNFTTYYKTNIPPNIVPDSEFLKLTISGNVLLPTFENLDDLVDKPTGCGEQNMIHFAPNVLVLAYLSATAQTSKHKDLVTKAKKYIELGYQKQLKFRHNNGGYSVFGPKWSKTPSNWLTAYVVRFFIMAIKYLSIETDIIDSSLSFLANQQMNNGEFRNAGYLFHPAYQSRYGFTAFVLLSYLENEKYAKKYKSVIEKALNFLSNNMNDIDDIYSLAIMATAFQMAKHEHASIILDKLRPLAKNQNDHQWWEDTTDDRVTDIEITSYILLALLHTPGQYLPIAKWLLEQRNSNGGFKSTQDTVVGLQALIKFSQLTAPQNDTRIKVLYRALTVQNKEIENDVLGLDPENAMILQHHQLPPATRSIDIEITGTGSVFLQFTYQYRKSLHKERNLRNDNELSIENSFTITTKVELTPNILNMDLELCIQYTPLKDVKNLKTNMIIAEIDLPSGYITNDEYMQEIKNNEDVDRAENERPDKIVLYFSHIEANKEKCINVLADKKNDVRNLEPSIIVVYDYYHSDRREVVTYEIQHNIEEDYVQ